MPTAPRLLVFAGSTREGSLNRRLAAVAAEVAGAAGAEVTLAGLRDFPMPLYAGDLEAASGMPEPAHRFRALMTAHHAFLIASPEYNSSIAPLLKNALDWASRKHPADAAPVPAFRGKVAGIMSASPGRLGGIRGLPHLRQVLTTLGVLVVPQQLALHDAAGAFAPDGRSLREAAPAALLEAVVRSTVRTAAALAG